MKLVPYSNITGQGAGIVLWTARGLAYLAVLGFAFCLFFFGVIFWQVLVGVEIIPGGMTHLPANNLLAPFFAAIPFVLVMLASALFAALAKYLSDKNAVTSDS